MDRLCPPQGPGSQRCTREPFAKVRSSQLGAQEQGRASFSQCQQWKQGNWKKETRVAEACKCGLVAFRVYGGHMDRYTNDVTDNNNNSYGSTVLPACQALPSSVSYTFSLLVQGGRYDETHSTEKESSSERCRGFPGDTGLLS